MLDSMQIDTVYQKGVGQINEDNLLVASPIFGVFDGASGLDPYKNDRGQTGAAIASSIARRQFSVSGENLVGAAHKANDAIADAMRYEKIDTSKKTALWATTASVVEINKDSFSWLKIGDSPILMILNEGSFCLLGESHDHDLETMVMWQELANQRTKDIRNVLRDQIIKVRREANIKYGVLNGEEDAKKFLVNGTADLDGVAHIILLTDGLLIPKEDPRQPEDFKTFVDLFLRGGLKKVQDYVRKQETSDPECWRYPRFKQHDDIAAVALSF